MNKKRALSLAREWAQGHRCTLQVRKSRYLPITQDESGMPTTITLVGPNGRCYTYKR